ncbi:phospholipid scramblase 4 [Culicoides brevitarsis]|uniref:phospholipid scramblase 4 n=1 Tax=Culicoides brevitarsis TaxID=469753 RepID=UPI00307B2F64
MDNKETDVVRTEPKLRYADPPLVHRGPTSILAPNFGESYDLSPNRQPIFTTNSSRSGGTNVLGGAQILPYSGLDYLTGIPSVHFHQAYELNESLNAVSSESRFTIRGPSNEALFVALERSSSKDRLLWGSSRPFDMHLLDKTHQESLIFERRHECAFVCCCCRSEHMFIVKPPGDIIGFIEEEFSLLSTELSLRNSAGEALYRISVPKYHKFYMPKEHFFKVMDGDNLTQKGSIARKWNPDTNLYTTNVYFTDPDLNVRLKSLYIGAAFLLEYMYFQSYLARC